MSLTNGDGDSSHCSLSAAYEYDDDDVHRQGGVCVFDFVNDKVLAKIFGYVDFCSRVRAERVCARWRRVLRTTYSTENWSVWVYLIFRKGLSQGHERLTVKISPDGPIFWSKMVVYVYCCSCHFNERHEPALLALLPKLAQSVRRVCAVDSPLNLPFLTNSFYEFLLDRLPSLEFLYLRELDLENLNASTASKVVQHERLKKVIVHECINYDALTEFGKTDKKLMVFTGAIQGLRALLGDVEFYEA